MGDTKPEGLCVSDSITIQEKTPGAPITGLCDLDLPNGVVLSHWSWVRYSVLGKRG